MQRWLLPGANNARTKKKVFALQDWFRRPDDEIRGRKRLWLPALFVNFVGPLAYLVVGRQRSESAG